MIIALDSETTGIDLRHGAKAFYVTICNELGQISYWEWAVDPLTREPLVDAADLWEIGQAINDADEIVCQNVKFDVVALHALRPEGWQWEEWPWEKTHETLYSGHLLASGQPHDLTTMSMVYLGINIKPLEEAVDLAIKEARKIADSKYPTWRIAAKGLPEMPSAKEKVYKYDMWLPRAVAKAEKYALGHPWWTVVRDYSNADSDCTVRLWKRHRELLEEKELWSIYQTRQKILPIVYGMESRGVTVNGHNLTEQYDAFKIGSTEAGAKCLAIAADLQSSFDVPLELPKSGVNNLLRDFIFNTMQLPVVGYTDGGAPALSKDELGHYLVTLEEGPKLDFITSLMDKRSRDTAIQYMDGYKRYWLPMADEGFAVLHPSLNPTGTNTLRWSSSNPNEQNISKKEKFNLRYCFGPAPGREWWSCDAQNIELRIPAFEAGEKEMIELFLHPERPPYFGSYHMLIFDTLHPKLFAEHGMECKNVFDSTWYQWTKNGNFAIQYGAQEESGTADAAYHVPGAQSRIQGRFVNIKALSDRQFEHAQRFGYVNTMPDRTVNPERGYPVQCTRTKWGKIKPTVPLSYHVQSTAMWWMMKAMIRCDWQLHDWTCSDPRGYYMILQVHDEIVFDFPAGRGPEPWLEHRPLIRKLQHLMAEGGNDLGLPTPVSCKYHAHTWSKGISV